MDSIDLRSCDAVCEALGRGAAANLDAACRRGSIDLIEAPGRLIATGDLHDNPENYRKVLELAGLVDVEGQATEAVPSGRDDSGTSIAHLTLHELIHAEHLMNGMDFSYRVLARVALLKEAHPEHVHVLLANHELAQVLGSGIVKDGVLVVDAFNDGLEYVFGGESERVAEAIGVFIRSMPLALRCKTPRGDILCCHSLPGPAMMQRFDPTVLDRALTEEDYQARRGSAHLMIWGRGYDAELLEDLVEAWGINMFILGHEHVESGAMLVEPNAVVLNSDHARGCCVSIDLDDPGTPQQIVADAITLASLR